MTPMKLNIIQDELDPDGQWSHSMQKDALDDGIIIFGGIFHGIKVWNGQYTPKEYDDNKLHRKCQFEQYMSELP